MLTLWNWYFTKADSGTYAHGIADGHPKLPDGLAIHTSAVQAVREEGGRLLVHTASGNLYTLLPETIHPGATDRTRQALADFSLPAGFLEDCLRAQKEAARPVQLPPGVLLLEVVGVSTLRAWFGTEEGEVIAIEPYIHAGMFQDSVLVTDWEEGEVDFRYFPMKDRLEPYHFSDGLTAIRVRNIGSTDVSFGSERRSTLCPAGETTDLSSEQHAAEGLFSPDAVNGKGLYRQMLEDEEE